MCQNYDKYWSLRHLECAGQRDVPIVSSCMMLEPVAKRVHRSGHREVAVGWGGGGQGLAGPLQHIGESLDGVLGGVP